MKLKPRSTAKKKINSAAKFAIKIRDLNIEMVRENFNLRDGRR